MSIGRLGTRWFGTALLFLAAPLSLLAAGCSSQPLTLTPGEREEMAQEIDKNLMCPVCPSETIDQSQVPIAKQIRAMVREKLAQGESRDDILQFFADPDRYGPSILAEPPKSGFNLLVWVIPPVLLVVGGGLLTMVVLAMRRVEQSSVHEDDLLSQTELDPYLAVVDQEIQRLTRSEAEVGSSAGHTSEEPDGRTHRG